MVVKVLLGLRREDRLHVEPAIDRAVVPRMRAPHQFVDIEADQEESVCVGLILWLLILHEKMKGGSMPCSELTRMPAPKSSQSA
jgi:hypothetical protein